MNSRRGIKKSWKNKQHWIRIASSVCNPRAKRKKLIYHMSSICESWAGIGRIYSDRVFTYNSRHRNDRIKSQSAWNLHAILISVSAQSKNSRNIMIHLDGLRCYSHKELS